MYKVSGIKCSGDAIVSCHQPVQFLGNTLERKKKGPRSPGPTSPEDFKSTTLGRRKQESNLKEKLFGSRNSLNKVQSQQQQHTATHGMDPNTIISNPHALGGKTTSPQSTLSSPGKSPYVNVEVGSYHPQDYTQGTPANGVNESSWIKVGSIRHNEVGRMRF